MKVLLCTILALAAAGCATQANTMKWYPKLTTYSLDYPLSEATIKENVVFTKDEFRGLYFATPKVRYEYLGNAGQESPQNTERRIKISPYLGYNKKQNSTYKLLRVHYANDTWLFFSSAILLCNDKTHQLNFSSLSRKTDIYGGNISEWHDIDLDKKTEKFLSTCEKGRIQLMGSTYNWAEPMEAYIPSAIQEIQYLESIEKKKLVSIADGK